MMHRQKNIMLQFYTFCKKSKFVPVDAMKACGLKVKLHIFLNAAIDGGKRLRNEPAPLRTKKIGRYTLKNEVWGREPL